MGALVIVWIHASARRKSIFAGFASILLTIILSGTGQLQAQETAVVLLDPNSLELSQGQTGRIVLRIEGAANVYGVQVDLAFDSSQIKVLDADETKPGVQIQAGDFLTQDGGFEAANEVNNEEGQVLYAYTRLAPSGSASGGGTLFEFEVEALESGSADLLLNSVIVASPDGDELPVRVEGATEESGPVILPTLTAPAPSPAAAGTAADAPVSSTPTAELSLTESPSAELLPADTPAATSPVTENSASPTETEAAAAPPVNSGESTAVNSDTPPIKEEREPAGAGTRTAETAAAGPPAAEIAAIPPTSEQEDSAPAAEQMTPALTVIGQNLNDEENEERPANSATISNNEGTIEGIYLAIGLTALIIALIAIWFLRRLQNR